MAPSTQLEEVDPFLPINIDVLHIGSQMPFEVFIRDSKGDTNPFLERGAYFTAISYDELAKKGVSKIYIRAEEKDRFDRYYRQVRRLNEADKTQHVFKEYTYLKDRYLQIDGSLLVPGTEINFGIFSLCKITYKPVIEASAAAPVILSEGMIAQMDCDLLVKDKEIHLYQNYISRILKSKSMPQAAKQKLKVSILREQSKIVLKEILDDPLCRIKFKTVDSMAGQLATEILQDENVVTQLISVKRHDFYSYVHSFNSAVLAAGLASNIGLPADTVRNITAGMMLHDVGKRTIPPDILHKMGDLTDTEYNIYKQHVLAGGELLKQERDLPPEAISIALQHHERLNGRGYPYKLAGSAISMPGRIAAITDAFDSLTTPRPNKYPLTPFYALQLLARDASSYDKELLAAFIKMLAHID